MPNTAEINSRPVHERRKLRFTTLDEMLADARQIAQFDQQGRLEQLGNWPAGQTFGHLATWMNYASDGYPMKFPLLLKLIGPLLKPLVLKFPMRAGSKIPKVPGGTYGMDALTTADGLNRLENAVQHFQQSPPTARNPIFGRLNPQQWTQLHLRHAELHLSFLVPKE